LELNLHSLLSMHVLFVSGCQKKAIKKTRQILDSYAMRTSETSWSSPMTVDGLKELETALRKVATRQTAVACYINDGRRRMKLHWIIGSRAHFGPAGQYPVGKKTRDPMPKESAPRWLSICALIAQASGYIHDIGKANVRFQKKLAALLASSDPIRHEWLSAKLAHFLRRGQSWEQAWELLRVIGFNDMQRFPATTPDEGFTSQCGITGALGAIDMIVMTHHRLFGSASDTEIGYPGTSRHIRQDSSSDEITDNLTPAGSLPPTLFDAWRSAEARLLTMTREQTNPLFWPAATLMARMAMIAADHAVSRIKMEKPSRIEEGKLFANSWNKDLPGHANQTLDWHCASVAMQAGQNIFRFANLQSDLPTLSTATIENILTPAPIASRFSWQNNAAYALAKLRSASTAPVLTMNMASTGSGKTRMNVRALACPRPEDLRFAVALNLKTLTLQTGRALKAAFDLHEDEMATVLGDQTSAALFERLNSEDEDGNPVLPDQITYGAHADLPSWLEPFYKDAPKQRTILAAPALISTVDYIVQAGQLGDQGHHIRSALRLMTSDLILDEIDSYEPAPLVALLRVIQMAAFFGRNVVCSSATLSMPVAVGVESAFRSGIALRNALMDENYDGTFHIAVIDDLQQAQIINTKASDGEAGAKLFQESYKTRLQDVSRILASRPVLRLGQIAFMEGKTQSCWLDTVASSVQKLHQQHHVTSPSGQRVSIGLVRVANIKHAQITARHLNSLCSHWQVACYHADDIALNRALKEQRLDTLLTRHGGDEHIFRDPEIMEFLSDGKPDLTLIVVATPVEEVGRDHDFDWGVIDLSSVGSLVQCAGRINRHRLLQVSNPNIAIPQFNLRACINVERGKDAAPCYVYPGYESKGFSYRPDAADMLGRLDPEQRGATIAAKPESQIPIDARLRFASIKMRKCDDGAINSILKSYFSSEQGIFSTFSPKTYTKPAFDKTRLRDRQPKQDGYYDFSEDSFFVTKLFESGPKDVRSGVNWEAQPTKGWLSFPKDLLRSHEDAFRSLRLSKFSVLTTKEISSYDTWLGFQTAAN
jgi:CRISPR-associated endonuclease/helicase Cas3